MRRYARLRGLAMGCGLALLFGGTAARAQLPPPGWQEPRCAMDLPPFATPFCAELVPTPGLDGVRGMLELRWVPTPFGVAVRPDGQLRHFLVARLEGLPPPASLGAYRAFVAWGYDLTHAREVKLGVVRNGANALGELPFENFRVLVSAESSAMVRTRSGRLVVRATSPGALLLAHRDAMATMLAGAPASEHAGHATGWPMPWVDPRIAPTSMTHTPPSTRAWLPDTTGRLVTPARPREVRDVRNGDTLQLTASLVRRTVAGRTFVMYGYNGQYPGPLIRVRQGANVTVQFRNALDLPTTIHWHGLRLDNRSDGVPHVTQDPVAPGDSFTYHLRFPDAGIYWYHPHVREDIQQDLGLYGNILVARRARAQVPVHREEVLALDDFLLTDTGTLMPYGADTVTHALMGRFGNLLLVNGEPNYHLQVRRGEVVRFHFTNVANARLFNLRLPGARLKLIGSDLGDFEREAWVESIVMAPAERYVVEARFDRPGRYPLLNSVRWLDHMRGTAKPVDDTLGVVEVGAERAAPDLASSFARLREHAEVRAEVARYRHLADREPDHVLTLGMRLDPAVPPATVAMLTGIAVPVDWNDAMPMMNFPFTARDVTWILRDEQGRENMAIAWQFHVGQVAKIRLVNDPSVTHAMAHPIHFHGQRFLVTSRNGAPNTNMVWKDTAVLPAGETMDILLELTNPGRWMMHCHVAEHLGTGMMGMFEVR
ncbi:MAG: multicopper oxidase domain-containing protein [Gemmatimonadaceae bacterium]|nr:multicopper oxidase domain-containing protein [Gemmatimonadaceae bacterium]